MSESADPDADQVAELFHEVVELDAAARQRLYEARAVAPSVRAEIESLLGEEPLAAFSEHALSAAGRQLSDQLIAPPPAELWQPGTEVGD